MSLSDLSVNRPVLATVFSLLLIVLGVVSFVQLPVREYPDIDPAVVTVTSVYTGANSEVIESEITDIIEEELTSVENVRTMTSTSRDEVSSIVLEFNLGVDQDIAAQDVRDKIARIRSRLPDDSEEPIVAKADSNAQPIMWIMVKSDKRDLLDLAEYVDREIKDYFQTVPGVSKVIFGGEKRKSIQVLIDPKRIAAKGLTITEVQNALLNNNVKLPSGRVISDKKEFTVDVESELKNVDAYKKLIVREGEAGISTVRLGDVAQILEGAQNDRSFVRFNGQQGFGLGILRQTKANTVEISKNVHKIIKQLQPKIPEDISLEVGFDGAVFVDASIKDVYKTIGLATLLVILIIFLFLGNIRSTFIPAISIPISLIGVMATVYAMGFTINLMTLLGLVIAVGIVVDDSIVVLENIYRYIEEGMDPKEAAKKGANEITMAVIATTLVLIAIFLPVAFMKGITGRLLSEFAFSICFATAVSSFVALTMAPMLCSKFLSKDLATRTKPFFLRAFDSVYEFFEKIYVSLISRVIKFKFIVSLFSLVSCFSLVGYFFMTLPKDFIPNEDRGYFMSFIQTPRGSSMEYMDEQMRKVENTVMKIPELDTSIAVAAFGRDAPGKVTEGILIMRLKHWKDRAKDVFGIVGPLFPVFGNIPEAFILPIFPPSGPGGGFGSQPIQLILKSNDVDYLVKLSAQITQRAFGLKTIQFARSNLSYDKPEFKVRINKDKALQLGVSVRDISETLKILFSGLEITDFNESGETYDVIIQVPRDERKTPNKLGEIGVRGKNGLILLSNLIDVEESVTAEEVHHHNRKNSATIEATPKEGFTAAQGLDEIEELARGIVEELKAQGISAADFEMDYGGTSKELKDANKALIFGFAFALLFAFLFLAGQFESFVYPLVIMFSVPLAIAGAFLGIFIFQLSPMMTKFAISLGAPEFIQFIIPQFKNISINIYSQIGIIMLVGMASKNGILLVEFMNQLREEGVALNDAIIQACKLRLRPILMTAFSTVLGILPIAIAAGIGAQSRQSMGVVVVFGMVLSTFLTLFVVPCAYALLSKERQ